MKTGRPWIRWFAAGVLAVSALGLAVGAGAQAPSPGGKPADTVELLFVQNSVSGTFDGKTLTLSGVGPTVFFSDRPQRVTGQVHTAEFIGHWDKGSDNFAENPPNAALSIFGPKGIESAVVELTAPSLKGSTLSYKARVLKGSVPRAFKESSLFIDILGRWRMYARGMAVGATVGAASASMRYAYHPAPVYVAAPVAAAPLPAPAPVYHVPAPPPTVNVNVAAPAGPTDAQASAVARLKELKSLQKQGLITQAQYQEESQKLLDQIVE